MKVPRVVFVVTIVLAPAATLYGVNVGGDPLHGRPWAVLLGAALLVVALAAMVWDAARGDRG